MKPIEKIRKLLALSTSSNEHEAKAALLKAQALMKEFNLSETDVAEKDKTVQENAFGFTFSKRRDPWMFDLCDVIARNFKCKVVFSRLDRTYTAKIVGFQEDTETALLILAYAYDCIQHNIVALKKQYKKMYSNKELKQILDGYGLGFARGLSIAFEKQKKEDESLALVLVIPEEVETHIKRYKTRNMSGKALQNISTDGYSQGKRDGEKFNPSSKLTGAENTLSA